MFGPPSSDRVRGRRDDVIVCNFRQRASLHPNYKQQREPNNSDNEHASDAAPAGVGVSQGVLIESQENSKFEFIRHGRALAPQSD